MISHRDNDPPNVAVDSTFTVRILHQFPEDSDLQEKWDNLVERLGGCIYMTYDWCRTWWRFYGEGKSLRLYLFTFETDLVGVLPLYIEAIPLGLTSLSVARLIGANLPPKRFELPIECQATSAALKIAASALFDDDHCDFVSLGPLAETQLDALCLERNLARQTVRLSMGVYTSFPLPETFAEYLDSLSRNEQKQRRKYELRLLQKEFQTEVRVLSEPSSILAEFDRFVSLHSMQWQAEGRPGHFRAWPRATEYNRELVRLQGKLGRVRFINIRANGTVISSQYAFALGQRLTWELPGRLVSAEWERFSLGRTGVVVMIQSAIEEGLREVEGGLGHYEYKLRLNAQEHKVCTLRIINPRQVSLFRYNLYKSLRQTLNVVYLKLWYRRVLPHLTNREANCQSPFWIRLDA
jgi:CelD/BcsL family acetyltransferase involved in cellulose biosynthesis